MSCHTLLGCTSLVRPGTLELECKVQIYSCGSEPRLLPYGTSSSTSVYHPLSPDLGLKDSGQVT